MPHLDPPGCPDWPGDRVPVSPAHPGRRPPPDRMRRGGIQPEQWDQPPPYSTRSPQPGIDRSAWPSAGAPPDWTIEVDPLAPLAGGGRTGRSRAQRQAETKTGRAGRNLPAATAVGGGLAAAVLASLLVWRPAFLAVVTAAVGVATWEMVRAMRVSGANPPLLPLLGGGAAMTMAAWCWGPEALTLGLLVTVLAVMVWRLGDGPAGYQRDIRAATLVTVYVPFLAGFAVLLAVPPDGHWRVLVTLATVVLSDTGGYVAGIFFGRHPMAPKVSPKKSWEGLAGSILAAAVGGGIGLSFLFSVTWWWGVLFGLVVAAAAVLGDLAESLLKRDLGVKDMSDLLPGHGGVMDRLDSILFAAPAAFFLLTVLVS